MNTAWHSRSDPWQPSVAAMDFLAGLPQTHSLCHFPRTEAVRWSIEPDTPKFGLLHRGAMRQEDITGSRRTSQRSNMHVGTGLGRKHYTYDSM